MLQARWNFTCQCRLCQVERDDTHREERKKLMERCKQYKSLKGYEKIAKLEPILTEVIYCCLHRYQSHSNATEFRCARSVPPPRGTLAVSCPDCCWT